MKKTVVLELAALLVAGLVVGCTKDREKENIVGMINPYVKQDTSAAFADLGIVMDAPEKAENVEYTIIADQMAQIDFTLKGYDYTLRATKKNGFTGYLWLLRRLYRLKSFVRGRILQS